MDHRQYSAQEDPVSSFTKSSEIYDSPFRSTAFAKRSDKKLSNRQKLQTAAQCVGPGQTERRMQQMHGKGFGMWGCWPATSSTALWEYRKYPFMYVSFCRQDCSWHWLTTFSVSQTACLTQKRNKLLWHRAETSHSPSPCVCFAGGACAVRWPWNLKV